MPKVSTKQYKYKVEEVDYDKKKMTVHYFENRKAAHNAKRIMLSRGHGANVYSWDADLINDPSRRGWSKRGGGSYIPTKRWNRLYGRTPRLR